MDGYELVDGSTPEGRLKIAEHKRQKAEKVRVVSNDELERAALVSVWKIAYELVTEFQYLKNIRPAHRALLTAMTAEELSKQRQIGFYLGKRSNAPHERAAVGGPLDAVVRRHR